MILSDPIPWCFVPPGAVVMLDGPRTVLLNAVQLDGTGLAFVESMAEPMRYDHTQTVRLVMLDEGDALATLAAAGLNPEIIPDPTPTPGER